MSQNNNSNKLPSQELFNLILELKITISELKELYKTIDKRALEEGFSIDEIYDIANVTETPITSSRTKQQQHNNNQTINITTTTAATNNNTKDNFPLHFQHYQ